MCELLKKSRKSVSLFLYLFAIILGAVCGYLGVMQRPASFISDVFVKIFKCLSLPIITISLIVSLSQQSSDVRLKMIGKRTLFYTIITTVVSSLVACTLYLIISPANMTSASPSGNHESLTSVKYSDYIASIIPPNIFSPFLEHNVMGALLIGIIVGVAIRCLPDLESKTVNNSFKIVHRIFLIIIEWVIKILPVALFGFISTAISQLKNGSNIEGLYGYLSVVILSNLVQGLIILPIFLYFNKIRPFVSLKAVLPALSIAFFSKSSVGTLPVTMDTAENNLGISHEISRFVLPLCTAINMNGCAAFIFTTVIYVMKNYGIEIDLLVLLQWIVISTIASIGNAGVPMGCFFLSVSLLTSMNVPIDLLWLILPFYTVIDMVETALNVWSDCCVARIVDKHFSRHDNTPIG